MKQEFDILNVPKTLELLHQVHGYVSAVDTALKSVNSSSTSESIQAVLNVANPSNPAVVECLDQFAYFIQLDEPDWLFDEFNDIDDIDDDDEDDDLCYVTDQLFDAIMQLKFSDTADEAAYGLSLISSLFDDSQCLDELHELEKLSHMVDVTQFDRAAADALQDRLRELVNATDRLVNAAESLHRSLAVYVYRSEQQLTR